MAKATTGGTCFDACGQQAVDGCWCDSYCEYAGDCCADKLIECGTASTVGGTCTVPIEVPDLNEGAVVFTDNTSTEVDDYSYEVGVCPGETGGWGSGASDHVYQLTASATGSYSVTLTPTTTFDSNLYVVTDCGTINTSTCVAADEQVGGGAIESIGAIDLGAGESVFIIVDGWGFGATGGYNLAIDCVRNACGTCGNEPPEICNGADDNCNGVVDDNCHEQDLGWQPFTGTLLELAEVLGGIEGLNGLVPAPRAMAPTMDVLLNTGPGPTTDVDPSSIGASELQSRLIQCGATVFDDTSIPLPTALRDAIKPHAWSVFLDKRGVVGIVDIALPEEGGIRWATLSPLSVEMDGDSVALSAPTPLLDFGHHLVGFNCGGQP